MKYGSFFNFEYDIQHRIFQYFHINFKMFQDFFGNLTVLKQISKMFARILTDVGNQPISRSWKQSERFFE